MKQYPSINSKVPEVDTFVVGTSYENPNFKSSLMCIPNNNTARDLGLYVTPPQSFLLYSSNEVKSTVVVTPSVLANKEGFKSSFSFRLCRYPAVR